MGLYLDAYSEFLNTGRKPNDKNEVLQLAESFAKRKEAEAAARRDKALTDAIELVRQRRPELLKEV